MTSIILTTTYVCFGGKGTFVLQVETSLRGWRLFVRCIKYLWSRRIQLAMKRVYLRSIYHSWGSLCFMGLQLIMKWGRQIQSILMRAYAR